MSHQQEPYRKVWATSSRRWRWSGNSDRTLTLGCVGTLHVGPSNCNLRPSLLAMDPDADLDSCASGSALISLKANSHSGALRNACSNAPGNTDGDLHRPAMQCAEKIMRALTILPIIAGNSVECLG